MVMAASESLFHVLAVDDSVIDRKLIERLLKTSSYQVTTVDSGSKALEFLGLRDDEISHPHPPACPPTKHSQEVVEVNLVITDYCMPGMTGYDLLKKMKESSSLRNIPVVIMSSENVPSRISRCLEEGAEEFFLKPVRLSDVNKLKPHMLKTKTKSHENNNPDPDNSKPPEKQDEQEQEVPTTATSSFPAEKLECGSQEAAETDDQQCDNSMNKRKGVEESASPDRTRSRYSSCLTAVSN